MSKCRSVTWSRPGAAEPAELGVVLEGGVVQGEAAFGFGDAKRYGRKGLRDRLHVDSVVRAEPAFDRLGTAAVDVHSVEFHALSFGGPDQGVNEFSHGGEPKCGV